MSLTPGTRLGPYEVIAPIGAGGMGEVYRARDTRLDRDVAIKVLPEALAADSDRRARFEREAKAVATLSHPNILAVFDTGLHPSTLRDPQGRPEQGRGTTSSGQAQLYVVMELLDGETLRARLAQGALPVRKAIEIAVQIARGLAAAHDKGIVHRDLKPENVFVMSGGQVKILDFGLARVTSRGSDASATVAVTDAGTVLGTVGYMAPEQVRGQTVDARTDLFALGAVLYEMLTGRRAFQRDTPAETMTAILRDDVPEFAMAGRGDLSPALDRIVRHCLEKEPAERFQTARDVVFALEGLSGSAISGPTPSHPLQSRRAWTLAAAAATVALATMLASWALMRTDTAGTAATSRVEISLEPLRLAVAADYPLGIAQTSFAWAPDGTSLVYVAVRNGQRQLYRRRLDMFAATPLQGTDGGYAPFFSPDGQWVAFFTETELKKVHIDGGTPQTVSATTNSTGGSWGADDVIVFAQAEGAELLRVSANGGSRAIIRQADVSRNHYWYNSPRVLPGGRGVLVTVIHRFSSSIVVVPLDTGDPVTIVERARGAEYVPTGHLVYGTQGGLMATRFDLSTLTVTGSAMPVLPGVRQDFFLPQLALSPSGTLAYLPGDDASLSTPIWVDRKTRQEQPIPGLPAQRYDGNFHLSGDGRRLAIPVAGTTADLFVYDFARADGLVKLTTTGDALSPVWSPDGRSIVYDSNVDVGKRGLTTRLFVQPIDGGPPRQMSLGDTDGQMPQPESWSRNGTLALVAFSPRTGMDIWTVSVDNFEKPTPFRNTNASEWGGTFSPRGDFIAYTSDESREYRVYVEPFPPNGKRWSITTGYGEEPSWSAAGNELFFRRGNQWLSVPVKTEPEFSWGAETVVFEGPYVNVGGISYAVAPDARRFLVLKEREQPQPVHIHVILNWADELKRLVPVD